MPKLKCKGCPDRFDRDTMIKIKLNWFHSFQCATGHAQRLSSKKAAADAMRNAKALRSKQRDRKEKIKTLPQLKAEAQTEFNKYIRMRDYWQPCISCGAPKEIVEAEQGWKVGGCWDAGHFKSRGAKPQLRFNTFNCHKQCKRCNGGSGRFSSKAATVDAQYEANLIDKIGFSKVDELNRNNESERFIDADYCRRVKVIFRKRANTLRKRLPIYQ